MIQKMISLEWAGDPPNVFCPACGKPIHKENFKGSICKHVLFSYLDITGSFIYIKSGLEDMAEDSKEKSEELSKQEIFNLIFAPGFSTAEKVTNVSGRGVGMDVVKKNIEAICGTAEIHSEKGKGSVFQMKLPLTLAIIDGMVARVGSEIYVIPTSSIVTSLRPESKNISKVMNKGEMLSIHGNLIPLFSVASLFDVERDSDITEESLVVIIENEDNSVGLIIDELVGRQQVVVKTLGESVQNITGISGGAIMPNGRVGLILDVGGMIKLSNLSMN